MNLTREMYKDIKKYDRQQMEDFYRDIYHSGFVEGEDAGTKADIKIELVQTLQATKGIGPKTIDKVMDTYNERMRG